jgi:pilus assembly protein CpaF
VTSTNAPVGRVPGSITDFGPLTQLIARPDVEEILFDGPRVSYLNSSGRLRGLTVRTGEAENRQVVERLLAPTDRQLNTKRARLGA